MTIASDGTVSRRLGLLHSSTSRALIEQDLYLTYLKVKEDDEFAKKVFGDIDRCSSNAI